MKNRNATSILKITLFSLFGLVIVLYSIVQGWKMLFGPIITIYTPITGTTFTEKLIDVTGKAKNVAYLNLDGRAIFTDKKGYFKEKLLLSAGYNIIEVDGTDKFGKKKVERLEVILKEY